MNEPTLTAECGNCGSWQFVRLGPSPHATTVGPAGVCTKGLAPAPGEPRCDRYSISKAFERAIVSRLMQDPTVVPVPLRGKTAKEARRKMRKGKA